MKLKPVCLLLCLCHAGSAAAFGLGEISVRSFLGQPLHATVTLLDITPAIAADCFSLDASTGSITPPPHAQLSIEQVGAQTLLHIRTSQPINDPVAQFVLVSNCEARLQRDYVVLLDPPAQVEAVSVREEPAVEQTAAASIATPAPAAPHRPHRVKRAPAVTATARPSAAAPRQPAAPPPHTTADRPRLVLSGKHRVAPAADTPIALRLDTHLPDLTQPRPEKLTATELSDENTALSRKLAHLEAQLAALQQRYAALEARRTAAPTVMPPPPKQPAQWPLYLLAIGLLSGGGVWAAWLSQRGRNHQPLDMADAEPWTHPDALPALGDMTQMPGFTPPAPQRMPEIAPPPREEDTEVKDDILDQAEVFMAHGHGDLAAHLLQEHLREAPTESPVPWLLLLDLLHRAGDTAGYNTASAECRRYFNVDVSNPPISQDLETGEGLESYPHLLEQLVHEWNSPDIEAFFNDLIYDHRGGTRLGFEPGAYRDILLLRAIAQQALPLAA